MWTGAGRRASKRDLSAVKTGTLSTKYHDVLLTSTRRTRTQPGNSWLIHETASQWRWASSGVTNRSCRVACGDGNGAGRPPWPTSAATIPNSDVETGTERDTVRECRSTRGRARTRGARSFQARDRGRGGWPGGGIYSATKTPTPGSVSVIPLIRSTCMARSITGSVTP